VVKFVGGALALPGTYINEFLGGYDSSWEAKLPKPPVNYAYTTKTTYASMRVPMNSV